MESDRGELKARKETGSAKGNQEHERKPGAQKETRSAKGNQEHEIKTGAQKYKCKKARSANAKARN
jgi:hypothetical protein